MLFLDRDVDVDLRSGLYLQGWQEESCGSSYPLMKVLDAHEAAVLTLTVCEGTVPGLGLRGEKIAFAFILSPSRLTLAKCCTRGGWRENGMNCLANMPHFLKLLLFKIILLLVDLL